MLKKIDIKPLFVLAFLLPLTLLAQYPRLKERVENLPNFDKRLIHYGYYVGLTEYDFKFKYIKEYYRQLNYDDIVVNKNTGFTVGLVASLRINEFVNLRFEPGLYYNARELLYPEYPEFTSDADRERKTKSTNIHLPLLLKVSTRRINNFRPYLLGGISRDFNLSSNEKNIDDNFSNEFRTTSKNLNYELGLGFDFYLFYFKFSPSIRLIFSMQNELIPDNKPASPWTGRIESMRSRAVVINLTFE